MRAEDFRSHFLFNFWRCFPISSKELQINESIKNSEIRVVDVDGSQLGIMTPEKALEIANEKNLDLVMIAPQADPAVCRIMDYGKYRFEQAKKEKESKKNQKVISVKEVRLSMSIDTHDFNTKLNQAVKFLKSGNKVKVSVRFRGREMAHTELGAQLLERFIENAGDSCVVEKQPKMEGRSMAAYLGPKA